MVSSIEGDSGHATTSRRDCPFGLPEVNRPGARHALQQKANLLGSRWRTVLSKESQLEGVVRDGSLT